MIDILYFARLREVIGRAHERLELPSGVDSIAKLVALLRARGDPWATALGGRQPVLTAVNQQIAHPETPVRDGDEIALFPPVTGG